MKISQEKFKKPLAIGLAAWCAAWFIGVTAEPVFDATSTIMAYTAEPMLEALDDGLLYLHEKQLEFVYANGWAEPKDIKERVPTVEELTAIMNREAP